MLQIISYYVDNNTKEVRCHKCGALLGKLKTSTVGEFEIKCGKCKTINNINFNLI